MRARSHFSPLTLRPSLHGPTDGLLRAYIYTYRLEASSRPQPAKVCLSPATPSRPVRRRSLIAHHERRDHVQRPVGPEAVAPELTYRPILLCAANVPATTPGNPEECVNVVGPWGLGSLALTRPLLQTMCLSMSTTDTSA